MFWGMLFNYAIVGLLLSLRGRDKDNDSIEIYKRVGCICDDAGQMKKNSYADHLVHV